MTSPALPRIATAHAILSAACTAPQELTFPTPADRRAFGNAVSATLGRLRRSDPAGPWWELRCRKTGARTLWIGRATFEALGIEAIESAKEPPT